MNWLVAITSVLTLLVVVSIAVNSTGRQPAQSELPPGWRKRRWWW
jgi:hypothetical protein